MVWRGGGGGAGGGEGDRERALCGLEERTLEVGLLVVVVVVVVVVVAVVLEAVVVAVVVVAGVEEGAEGGDDRLLGLWLLTMAARECLFSSLSLWMTTEEGWRAGVSMSMTV